MTEMIVCASFSTQFLNPYPEGKFKTAQSEI